jgi:hypothetical protein
MFLIAVWAEFILPLQAQGYCGLMNCATNLFVLPDINHESVILYRLGNHHYNDYTTRNIVATAVAHTVKVFIMTV